MYFFFVSASFWVALVICIFQSTCPFHLIYEHKVVNSGLLFYCYRVCNEALFLFLILVICVFFYFLVWLARSLAILIDLFKIPVFVFIDIFCFVFYLIDFCSYFYISLFWLMLGLNCSLNKFLR